MIIILSLILNIAMGDLCDPRMWVSMLERSYTAPTVKMNQFEFGKGSGKSPRKWAVQSMDGAAELQLVDLGPRDSEDLFLAVHGLTANGAEFKPISKELRRQGVRHWLTNLRGDGNRHARSIVRKENRKKGIMGLFAQLDDLETYLAAAINEKNLRRREGKNLRINLLNHSRGALLARMHLMGFRWINERLVYDPNYAKTVGKQIHGVWNLSGPVKSKNIRPIIDSLERVMSKDQILKTLDYFQEVLPTVWGTRYLDPDWDSYSHFRRLLEAPPVMAEKLISKIFVPKSLFSRRTQDVIWFFQNEPLSWTWNSDIMSDFARLGINRMRFKALHAQTGKEQVFDLSKPHPIHVGALIEVAAENDQLVPFEEVVTLAREFQEAGHNNVLSLRMMGYDHFNQVADPEALGSFMKLSSQDPEGFRSLFQGAPLNLKDGQWSTLEGRPISPPSP